MSEILTSQKLKDAAMQAWATDKDLYARSEKSAESLGAALIEVEKALPYGEYGPWLKASGINRNRASYCVRKVNGKDKAAREKAKARAASHVTTLKANMLVRWNQGVFKVTEGSEESDKLVLKCLAVEPEAYAEPAELEPTLECTEPENGIVFNVLEMQRCLNRLSAVACRKAQEPIYGNIRLSSDESGVVRLLGVDIDSTLTVMLPTAKWYGPVRAVCLEYKQLQNLVKGLKTKEASITFVDESATISSGAFKCNIQTYPVAKFSDLTVVQVISEKPDIGGFSIGLLGLKEQIEQVTFAIPSPDGKFPVPVGLLESTSDTLRMVATDGYSIAIADSAANLGEFSYTLPKPLLKMISKLDGGTTVNIVDNETAFYVETDLELLTYPKTHFDFPPYRRVIPALGTFPTRIFVDACALANALKRLLPNADEEEPGVMFTVAENGKNLELHATDNVLQATGDVFARESRDAIPAEVVGSPNHFTLNLKKLLPFLDRIEGQIELVCRDAFHVIDMHANGGTYRFLQMPLREGAGLEGEKQKAA